ncbi:hypothetical protein EDD16DRAFT_520067 [Pisolithus croceorrhizus]|nr:hypothetical protein F5141DRAFT_218988 [Pisolithus sp. B1]KAI6124763.1 hypothetical protein EDD16DRAFT_520067 [Pisolithus croceorrhizus]KAI6160444.1 hypothetical protein EDD17DRAFT_1484539 [Pisolithus thermaeus]
MSEFFSTETFTESVVSRLPRNTAVCFVHEELFLKNTISQGCTVTGIVSWLTAGFHRECWENCRMHDPSQIIPGSD